MILDYNIVFLIIQMKQKEIKKQDMCKLITFLYQYWEEILSIHTTYLIMVAEKEHQILSSSDQQSHKNIIDR